MIVLRQISDESDKDDEFEFIIVKRKKVKIMSPIDNQLRRDDFITGKIEIEELEPSLDKIAQEQNDDEEK
ncbi:hypothetical protein C1645_823513 [Glomus cerebriforme]|uniref:Uncharacterized protein n=1 Tax=Glomus cerebriforme TaxID=658196 RepID=A0A397T574_9GLOM|nr:hypothetical protein C1645_823513 [Glomus cerebriforme]